MSFTLLFRRRRGRVNSTAKRNKENTITNELDGEALKDPCSPNGTHVTELPTPRSITKFVIPASMLPGIDGGELPAALPVEVPGDVFMNEHHPATIPHIASLGKLSGIDEKIEESEVAPAYTLVSGSILGPLSEETREDGEAKTEASEQPSAIPNSSSPKVSYTLVDSTKMVSPLSPQGDASRTEGAAVLQRRSAPQRRRG